MYGSRLVLALVIVGLMGGSAGCRFYVGAEKSDALVDRDAQDVDPDGAVSDAEVVVDAAPPDASLEKCGDFGGICTASDDAICPVGTRPLGDDTGLDCNGHCCVPDPPSTCNSNQTTNCSMMPACTGCWAPATDATLECDGGRLCCEWICD